MSVETRALIQSYYDAFNRWDMAAFLDLLADDVVHDVNQGERQVGKEAFSRFMAHMDRFYQERLVDLVVMTSADDTRAAAEFIVEGRYKVTDPGLPPARGQTYRLPAGAFFEVRGGKVARVSNYYNLQDWLKQVQ